MKGLRKRVLLIAGADSLGPRLCERLLEHGCDVLCLDNFYTSGNGDRVRRRPNLTKARRTLGWEPTVRMEEGLARTGAHFREQSESDPPC